MDITRVTVIGASGAGKSTIVYRLCAFNTPPTARSSEDIWNRKYTTKDHKTKRAEIFDSYASTTQRRDFLELSQVVIVVFDLSSEHSLELALQDAEEAMANSRKAKWVLVGNSRFGSARIDIENEFNKFRRRVDAVYFEVDALNRVGIKYLAEYLFV